MAAGSPFLPAWMVSLAGFWVPRLPAIHPPAATHPVLPYLPGRVGSCWWAMCFRVGACSHYSTTAHCLPAATCAAASIPAYRLPASPLAHSPYPPARPLPRCHPTAIPPMPPLPSHCLCHTTYPPRACPRARRCHPSTRTCPRPHWPHLFHGLWCRPCLPLLCMPPYGAFIALLPHAFLALRVYLLCAAGGFCCLLLPLPAHIPHIPPPIPTPSPPLATPHTPTWVCPHCCHPFTTPAWDWVATPGFCR